MRREWLMTLLVVVLLVPVGCGTPAEAQSGRSELTAQSGSASLTTASSTTTYYTVQSGDTLYSLARRYGTTVAAITEANHLPNPNNIRVGQGLIIPTGGTFFAAAPGTTTYYIVRSGDTLYSLARRHGTTVETITEANHLPDPNYIRVGQGLIIPTGAVPPTPTLIPPPPCLPPASWSLYIVQPGDTLPILAARYGTSPEAIIQANCLSSSIIYSGQQIYLPPVYYNTPTPTPLPPPLPPTPTPTSTPVEITDWRGEYYNNPDLSGAPILVRNDTSVNFNWGTGSPPGVPVSADHFSVRWSRRWTFPAGLYRFHVRVDDGARLWVDGYLVIDQWHDSPPTTYTEVVNLAAGWHDLKVEYYERDGGAQIEVKCEPQP